MLSDKDKLFELKELLEDVESYIKIEPPERQTNEYRWILNKVRRALIMLNE